MVKIYPDNPVRVDLTQRVEKPRSRQPETPLLDFRLTSNKLRELILQKQEALPYPHTPDMVNEIAIGPGGYILGFPEKWARILTGRVAYRIETETDIDFNLLGVNLFKKNPRETNLVDEKNSYPQETGVWGSAHRAEDAIALNPALPTEPHQLSKSYLNAKAPYVSSLDGIQTFIHETVHLYASSRAIRKLVSEYKPKRNIERWIGRLTRRIASKHEIDRTISLLENPAFKLFDETLAEFSTSLLTQVDENDLARHLQGDSYENIRNGFETSDDLERNINILTDSFFMLDSLGYDPLWTALLADSIIDWDTIMKTTSTTEQMELVFDGINAFCEARFNDNPEFYGYDTEAKFSEDVAIELAGRGRLRNQLRYLTLQDIIYEEGARVFDVAVNKDTELVLDYQGEKGPAFIIFLPKQRTKHWLPGLTDAQRIAYVVNVSTGQDVADHGEPDVTKEQVSLCIYDTRTFTPVQLNEVDRLGDLAEEQLYYLTNLLVANLPHTRSAQLRKWALRNVTATNKDLGKDISNGGFQKLIRTKLHELDRQTKEGRKT